jgi:hypothetical protein
MVLTCDLLLLLLLLLSFPSSGWSQRLQCHTSNAIGWAAGLQHLRGVEVSTTGAGEAVMSFGA